MQPNPKPSSCQGCPAYEWGVGFVPPEGPLDAKVCLIGQGPGDMEARFSRPFYPQAPSGRNLQHQLGQCHAQRSQVLLTNLVWCWLPARRVNRSPQGNREPTQPEIDHCTQAHLFPLLDRAGFLEPSGRGIVTIGAPASRLLMGVEGGKSIDRYIGTFRQLDLRDRHQGAGNGLPGEGSGHEADRPGGAERAAAR